MMRWQEPLNNISHLIERINRKDRLSIFYADLNDHPSIYRMIDLIRPDFISHLAAQSYPRTSFDIPIETLQTNIIGTANLLEVIKQIRNKENLTILLYMYVLPVRFMEKLRKRTP